MAGNLAFQSGAIYLVQLNATTSTLAKVTGTATLGGNVLAAFAPGTYLQKQYTILQSAGLGGTTFAGFSTTNIPAGFIASLSYTPTSVLLNLKPGLTTSRIFDQPADRRHRAEQLLHRGRRADAELPDRVCPHRRQPSSEIYSATVGRGRHGSTAGDFPAPVTQFLGIMSDPTINGRGNSALRRWQRVIALPTRKRSPTPRASKSRPLKASVMPTRPRWPAEAPAADVADAMQRWSVWGCRFRRYTDDRWRSCRRLEPDHKPDLWQRRRRSNCSPARRIRSRAIALAWHAGTTSRVDNGGTSHSDLFQAGAFVAAEFPGQRCICPAPWPMAGRMSPPTVP